MRTHAGRLHHMTTVALPDTPQHYDAVIVGAGSIAAEDELCLRALVKANPHMLIIAADGGADTVTAWGLNPQYIIGDFDSVSKKPHDHRNTIALPVHKDETDMHEALTLAWQHGARRIALFGALGGRIDHTLANIQLLGYVAAAGGNGALLHNGQAITVLTQGVLHFPTWYGCAGHMVSVFAHSDNATNVTIDSLLYEAQLDLINTHAQGVSNEFVHGKAAHISVEQGLITVTWHIGKPVEKSPAELAALLTPQWSTSRPYQVEAFGTLNTQTSSYYSA